MKKLADMNISCRKITVPSTIMKCEREVPISSQDPWSVTKKKKCRPMTSEKTSTMRKSKDVIGLFVAQKEEEKAPEPEPEAAPVEEAPAEDEGAAKKKKRRPLNQN